MSVAILSGLASCRAQNSEYGRVVLGDEQFQEYLPLLKGKRVAVYSNHTGIVGDFSRGLLVPAGKTGAKRYRIV